MSHPTTMDPLLSTPAQPREDSDSLRLNGAAVLIVDEDPAFQLGLKTFLKEYVGFSEVHTARDGTEALARLADTPSIEIVTLDYKMPRMDGLEFLTRLKEAAPRPMSIIMITGYPSDHLEEQFRSFHSSRLQTEHFLTKPIEFEKLESVILDSYESLKRVQAQAEAEALALAAQKAAEQPKEEDDTKPVAEALSIRVDSSLRRIADRLDSLEAQVAALAAAPQPSSPSPVPAFAPRQEPDVARLAKTLLKGMVLIFFAWAIVRHGLLDRMLEGLGFDPVRWFQSLGRPPAP